VERLVRDGEVKSGIIHTDPPGKSAASGPHLRLLAELASDIGERKFPDLIIGDAAPGEIPGSTGVGEKASARALQLLAVMAEDDLTLTEAADQLCISIHTANQHVAAARRAFGAATTTGAVYAAMQHGLIEV
jgi:DNA-binding CsgD family transcriptional regulator